MTNLLLKTKEKDELTFVRPKIDLDAQIAQPSWDDLLKSMKTRDDYYRKYEFLDFYFDEIDLDRVLNEPLLNEMDNCFDSYYEQKEAYEAVERMFNAVEESTNSTIHSKELKVITELLNDALKGEDDKLIQVLDNIYAAIQSKSMDHNQLANLDQIRILILLLKSRYDSNTLEHEIYDELDDKITEILRQVKQKTYNKRLKSLLTDVRDTFMEILEGNSILHKEGEDFVFQSTDNIQGEYKEYQLKKK